MRDFVVFAVAAAVKWLILFTVPVFAIDGVLKAPDGLPTLKALLLAVFATAGAIFIAFRLEATLHRRLLSENNETISGIR